MLGFVPALLMFTLVQVQAPEVRADIIDKRSHEDRTFPFWGLELRLGAYQPQVSTVGAERDFYLDMFSTGGAKSLIKNRPLIKTIENDWYLARRFGLLGPYWRIGHWSITGKTLECSAAPCSAENKTAVAGTGTNSLTVLPLSVGLVYRFDLLKRHFGVPLVPYVKAGVDYYFWWTFTNGKITRTADKKQGKGGTWGYSGAAGLAFNLDILEPQAATRGRSTSHIADSYIFGEYNYAIADNFGKRDRLDFSDGYVTVGLAIDFL